MMNKNTIPIWIVASVLLCCRAADAQQNLRWNIFGAAGGESAAGQSSTATASSGGFVPPPATGTVPLTPTGVQASYGGGGGVELLLAPQFGFGAGIAGFKPGQTPSMAVGIFSANGYFHFHDAILGDKKFDPFLTGGYSLIFRDYATSGLNLGAGFNYWFKENVGIVFAGQGILLAKLQGVDTKFFEIRVGFTFR